MPVSGAVERRRRKAALQNDLRDQRHRNRVNREEAMRDQHAIYMQNRRGAADAIGSQYGPATRSAYLQGRSRGGAAGEAASAATAQGLRTAQYVGQQNAFANDLAQRYATRTNADANYQTGLGNHAAGIGAMHAPVERTRQAQIEADAQVGVADRHLAGVYDTNSASRFANVNDNRTALYQTDMSAGVARDQIASQERLASMPVARDIVPLGDGTTYYDPALGRAVGEDEQAQQAAAQQAPARRAALFDDLISRYPAQAHEAEQAAIDEILADNPELSREDAEAQLDADPQRFEQLLMDRVHGKARGREFSGGDINPLNARFWRRTDPVTGQDMGGFTNRIFN